MPVKTIMGFHLMPVRMAAIKKSTNINARKVAEKKELSYIVGGSAN